MSELLWLGIALLVAVAIIADAWVMTIEVDAAIAMVLLEIFWVGLILVVVSL